MRNVGSVVAVVAVGNFTFAGAIAVISFTAVWCIYGSYIKTVINITFLTFTGTITPILFTSIDTTICRPIIAVVFFSNLALG